MSEYLRDRSSMGALLIPAQVSSNPASVASTGMSGTTYAVIGALGIAGYLLYRHFKKSGGSTPSEGQ